jgi:hypothetical protein
MADEPSRAVLEALPMWAVLGLIAVAHEELDDAKACTAGSVVRAQADIHQPPLSGIHKCGAVVALELRHALEHVLNATAILTEAVKVAELVAAREAGEEPAP